MATVTAFVCQACGHRSAKWLGRCPECEAWSSFVEEAATARPSSGPRAAAKAVALAEIEREAVGRTPSGLAPVDRVLGGGVVAGSAVLLAGEPGIGKSTLLLQLAHRLAAGGRRVLYASAEESPRQLRLRAERLGAAETANVLVVGETELEAVEGAIAERQPEVVLVDSIQALRSDELESPPGALGQVRHAANRLVALAKANGFALFLVGHVTKEGSIAGPKALEHLVDTVLSFEGARDADYRLLFATKNRFGPTGEMALFEMREGGLEPVPDPSGVLLARRRSGAPGSAVLPTLSGTRPLLVEVQALVHPTSFPAPRRMAVGLDGNRTTLLVAVLERSARIGLGDRDLFANVVGGLTLREPACDLALAAAIVSAERGVALPADAVYFGEVGLLGEVRPVGGSEARLREAASHGFRRAYCARTDGLRRVAGIEVVEIATVEELADSIR